MTNLELVQVSASQISELTPGKPQQIQLAKVRVMSIDVKSSAPLHVQCCMHTGSTVNEALQIVEAFHHAGTNPRVKGLITCIGDKQSFSGPAQVQELRNAVFDFRSVLDECGTLTTWQLAVCITSVDFYACMSSSHKLGP